VRRIAFFTALAIAILVLAAGGWVVEALRALASGMTTAVVSAHVAGRSNNRSS
jgi:hypothetical protein